MYCIHNHFKHLTIIAEILQDVNPLDNSIIICYTIPMTLASEIREASELHGEFTLRSKTKSSIYFDKYRLEADPALLLRIARKMSTMVPSNIEVLCGLEMGGIPLVTMMSHLSSMPAAFIRKEAKTYGTCQYAEGTDLTNKALLIVEDVVSSGGAILDAVAKMRNDGYTVDYAICIIDRETGGKEKLKDNNIILSSLFTMSEISA